MPLARAVCALRLGGVSTGARAGLGSASARPSRKHLPAAHGFTGRPGRSRLCVHGSLEKSRKTASPSPASRATSQLAKAQGRGQGVLSTEGIETKQESVDSVRAVTQTIEDAGEVMLSESQQSNLMLNQAVVATFLGVSLWTVGSVDVAEELAREWTFWQYMTHLPQLNVEAYLMAVAANPLLTKAMTSGIAYGLGDFLTQIVRSRKLEEVQMSRTLRSATAGFLIHGPFCHYWIQWMEANLSFNGAWYAVPAKVIADQTGWSLFLNTMYTSTILGLQGKKPGEIKQEVQYTWFKALSAGWKFWPMVHCVTFSSLIPEDLKLLFVDCVEVVWVMILSQTVNRDSQKAPDTAECDDPNGECPVLMPEVTCSSSHLMGCEVPEFYDVDYGVGTNEEAATAGK